MDKEIICAPCEMSQHGNHKFLLGERADGEFVFCRCQVCEARELREGELYGLFHG